MSNREALDRCAAATGVVMLAKVLKTECDRGILTGDVEEADRDGCEALVAEIVHYCDRVRRTFAP